MVHAVILICKIALSISACTPQTADDKTYFDVPAKVCPLAAQIEQAKWPADRIKGYRMVVRCNIKVSSVS